MDIDNLDGEDQKMQVVNNKDEGKDDGDVLKESK